MKGWDIVWSSTMIGGVFGGLLAIVYPLFTLSAVILWTWLFGEWPGNWTGRETIPYVIISCAIVGGLVGVFLSRRGPHYRSCRIVLAVLGVMTGAGIGTGPVLGYGLIFIIFWSFAGAGLGMSVGAVFGGVVAAIAKFSGASWEEQLQHRLRLRILASSISAVSLLALYLGIHARAGITPSVSIQVDYLVVPMVIAAAVALPIWICGPSTESFY